MYGLSALTPTNMSIVHRSTHLWHAANWAAKRQSASKDIGRVKLLPSANNWRIEGAMKNTAMEDERKDNRGRLFEE